jgi:O-antigen ligase
VFVGVVAIVAVFSGVIFPALKNYFDRGVSDSGRFDLWEQAVAAFRESPIFGKGFFGLYPKDPTDLMKINSVAFLPDMAHNTVIQLFSSMGIFGFGAYLYYRVCSLKPFFKVPTLEKTMMLMAILTVLLMSLLDNFVFYIYIMFYPTILLAVAHRFRYDGERRVKSFDANQLEITEDCSFIDVRIKPTKK